MTIDPVKIPQNVYVEDRIVGPITLRQIIICLLTGAVSYGTFASVKAANALNAVTGILAWTPLMVGAAFAFVKINGITLTRFVFLFLEKMNKPAVRKWSPRKGITISFGTVSTKSHKEVAADERAEEMKRREEEKRKRIQELSALLDKGPSESDPVDGGEVSSSPTPSALPVDRSRIKTEPLTVAPKSVDSIHENTASVRSPVVCDLTPPKTS